jgi:hypothetical protein
MASAVPGRAAHDASNRGPKCAGDRRDWSMPSASIRRRQSGKSVRRGCRALGTPGEYATGMDRADKVDGRIACEPPRGSNLDASGARGAGGGLTRQGEVQYETWQVLEWPYETSVAMARIVPQSTRSWVRITDCFLANPTHQQRKQTYDVRRKPGSLRNSGRRHRTPAGTQPQTGRRALKQYLAAKTH